MVKTISKIGGSTCSEDYENMIRDLSTKYKIDIPTFQKNINAKLLTSDTPLNWLILKKIIDTYNDSLDKFTKTQEGTVEKCKDPFIGFLQTLSKTPEFFKTDGKETYFIKITSNAQTFTLSWDNFANGRDGFSIVGPYTDFINKLRNSIITINTALSYTDITIIPPNDLNIDSIKFILLEKEIEQQIQKVSNKTILPNFDITAEFTKFINDSKNHLESLLIFLFQIENISVRLANINNNVSNTAIREKNISDANTELINYFEKTFKTNFENEKKVITTPPQQPGGSKQSQIVDKYVYKNKKYKIRFGPKGGKYILVDGETIRI